MSYSVTIEASTIVELGGKVLALAAQFNQPMAASVSDPVMDEVKETVKPTKAKAEKAPAAEAPAVEETPAAEAPVEVTNVSDEDLRDLVIGLVKAKGREVMPPILAQFGVAKATEITDPAQRLELANALRDAMD